MARKASVERAKAKVGGFATAKKNISIQFQNNERTEHDILNKIKEDITARGIEDDDISELNIYIKPEEYKIYYVVNGDVHGAIEF